MDIISLESIILQEFLMMSSYFSTADRFTHVQIKVISFSLRFQFLKVVGTIGLLEFQAL